MANPHGSDKSTAGLSAERIGRNDSIFRQANERINWFAEAQQIGDQSPFICECADGACTEVVWMTLAEYSEIRRDARRFLGVPGHEASDQGWGQVIEKHGAYDVVEKIGPAAAVAEQLEGSSAPETAAIDADARRGIDDPV